MDQPETAAEVGEDTGPLNTVQDVDEPSYARPYLDGVWGDQGDAAPRADWPSANVDEPYADAAYGETAHADAGLADAGHGDVGAQGAAGDVLDDGWRTESESGAWPATAGADQWNGAESGAWGAEGGRPADEQAYDQAYDQAHEQHHEQDYDLAREQGHDQAYAQGDEHADSGATARWTESGEGGSDRWGDTRPDDLAEGDSGDAHWSDPEEWHRTRYGDEPAEPRTGFLGSGNWRQDPDDEETGRPKRRSGKLLAVAAVAVLGMTLGGVWLFSGSDDTAPVASDRVPSVVEDSALPDDSELLGEPTSGPTGGAGEPTVRPTVDSTSTPAQPVPRATTRHTGSTHEPTATREPAHTRQPRTTTSHPAPQNSTFSGNGDPQHVSGSTRETVQQTSDPQPQASSAPQQDDFDDISDDTDSSGGSGSGGESGDSGGGGGGGGLLGWLFGRH